MTSRRSRIVARLLVLGWIAGVLAPGAPAADAPSATLRYLGLGSNRRCATSSSNCATREAGQVIKNFDSLQVR